MYHIYIIWYIYNIYNIYIYHIIYIRDVIWQWHERHRGSNWAQDFETSHGNSGNGKGWNPAKSREKNNQLLIGTTIYFFFYAAPMVPVWNTEDLSSERCKYDGFFMFVSKSGCRSVYGPCSPYGSAGRRSLKSQVGFWRHKHWSVQFLVLNTHTNIVCWQNCFLRPSTQIKGMCQFMSVCVVWQGLTDFLITLCLLGLVCLVYPFWQKTAGAVADFIHRGRCHISPSLVLSWAL